MKKSLKMFIASSLCLCVLLSSCAGSETPHEVEDTAKDKSGKYVLSIKGEAIIDDVALTNAKKTADNNRVFYEIFVGSFSDSNGDGIGDLRGIINKFDYLNDGDDGSGMSLGVEGIWLTPIFKSPSYHKYDVTDYYTIDPAFGTEDDLRELVALCRERNVKLIIDLPINHTGYMCSWFSEFILSHRRNDTENKYYDYYCFYKKGESAPAGRAFSQVSGSGDYYECNFSGDMPELDFDNPDVRDEVLNIAKHYLDLGVDGFRFDAAKYIYYGDNAKCVEFWDWYLSELRSVNPDIYTVAEVWDGDGITDLYYPALDCFDFSTSQVSGLIAETAKGGDVNRYTSYVENYVSRVEKMRDGAMIIPFVTNHDMDRAAGFLTAASGNMKMAANLYILSAGSPFIYYGEELGMRGSRGGALTDADRRLAMVWGDGDTVKNPVGAVYPDSSQIKETAVDQKSDGDSLYSYYKKLIMIRKANPEICRGEYKALEFKNTKLGGFTSTYDGETVCVIHNTTKKTVTYDLKDVTDLEFETLAAYIGVDGPTVDEDGNPITPETPSLVGTILTIPAQTSVILR